MYTQSQASTAADQHHSAALSKNTIHAWSLLHLSGGTLENRNRLSATLHCTVGLFDFTAYYVPVTLIIEVSENIETVCDVSTDIAAEAEVSLASPHSTSNISQLWNSRKHSISIAILIFYSEAAIF